MMLQVKAQDQPEEPPNTDGLLQVAEGEPVLLTCQLPRKNPSTAYWQTAETDQVVYVLKDGQEVFEHQSPGYHLRTRLLDKPQSGNFNVLLNVSEHDNFTTFLCYAYFAGDLKPTLLSNITLLVKRNKGKECHSSLLC